MGPSSSSYLVVLGAGGAPWRAASSPAKRWAGVALLLAALALAGLRPTAKGASTAGGMAGAGALLLAVRKRRRRGDLSSIEFMLFGKRIEPRS